MISKILDVWHKAEFDFRKYANPDDELKHLFDEWVDYYRLKWAIAKVIKPRSIFEIGVRYGYSAQAFLAAAPKAHYVGIDLDSNEYGGEKGAIDWAKKKLKSYNVDISCNNSQEMERFPGKVYDLIHVDGQQDGDSSYWDLTKAIKQGRYILVDGFFWSAENQQSCNTFLQDNKELIEYYFVIPGYAGELLIKVKENKALDLSMDSAERQSEQIRSHYVDDYYLLDCGGFAEYKAYGGQKLLDSRLESVYRMAGVKKGMHVVDAGCGRGEVAFACAKAGATVDAIDYSESALNLARECFIGQSELQRRTEFHCCSMTDFDFKTKADVVLASDLVEHMAPDELDKMYDAISKGLTKTGRFIVHTFPNLWFYQYGYKAERKSKLKLGLYTSPEPRSYYERLMHINEQSPRVLRDQLQKYFKYVLVWFGTPDNPISSLSQKYRKSDCMRASSIYAIASNEPIDIEKVKESCVQKPLTEEEVKRISLSLVNMSNKWQDDTLTGTVKIANANDFSIRSAGPTPVHLAFHWLDKQGNMLLFDGTRTAIPEVFGDDAQNFDIAIRRPKFKGHLILQLCLVQENVCWFENIDTEHVVSFKVVN